jgi:hypothetical protein
MVAKEMTERRWNAGRLLRRCVGLLCLGMAATQRAAPAADAELAAYTETIRPLLATRCFSCHGGLRQEAGLRLDTVPLMLAGGESGPAVSRVDPEKSLLLERVREADPAERMPPEGEGEPLTAEQVAVVRAWIAAGCPAPADEVPEADPRDHWAFRPPTWPDVPRPSGAATINNPIDAFVAVRRERAGVVPQPEAPRHVLVRRLFIDLVGLPPQPDELAALEADASPDWYERLVDRLLADPRHGERWARHWMDVWRYADWWGHGGQHRYSQKHMWHFRDWIVESLNADTGYDEMVRLMLAADELRPDDLGSRRATGFLARNWFVFNRGPWLDATVEHVGKGLLGLTLNCTKCHAHKYDPIPQEDYYRFRAFFEPLQTRMDVLPGESDLEKDGIPCVFDADLEAPTYRLVRGEESRPDTSKRLLPGVPDVLGFAAVSIAPVTLPRTAHEPERRPWVLDAHLATAKRSLADAEAAQAKEQTDANRQRVAAAGAELVAVERRIAATRAAWSAAAADAPSNAALQEATRVAARSAAKAEKDAAVARAWADVAAVSERLAKAVIEKAAAKRLEGIEKDLVAAREAVDKATRAAAAPGETFTPLTGARWTATRFKHSGADDPPVAFPATSSGRRSALARWLTDPRHPLTARVAVNHIWMRHIGTPLVATVFDFGRKGAAPTHPELLDWLACELVDGGGDGRDWSMKHLHRLICTSAAYRMGSSTIGADTAAASDPDNRLLWRREPIRLESQVVRDAVLSVAGMLDPTIGGPSVPEADQPASRRRSLYFWHSDLSRNPFLEAFDDAPVTECYRREQSIVPQQALALANAALVHDAAAAIAARVRSDIGTANEPAFIDRAFRVVLGRHATAEERTSCEEAAARWRSLSAADAVQPADAKPVTAQTTAQTVEAHIVWALLNHNDFLTLR